MKKLSIVILCLMYAHISYGQYEKAKRVRACTKINEGEWGDCKDIDNKIIIKEVSKGVFSIVYYEPDRRTKNEIKQGEEVPSGDSFWVKYSTNKDGRYLYETMGMLTSFWMGKEAQAVVTEIPLESIIKNYSGNKIYIHYDLENAVVYGFLE